MIDIYIVWWVFIFIYSFYISKSQIKARLQGSFIPRIKPPPQFVSAYMFMELCSKFIFWKDDGLL